MTVKNPFPGLRPFEPDESHLFFGREASADELLAKLRNNRFISVIGTSGSGKSSLVRAGLLPDLYGGFMTSAGSDWRIALLRPGNSPIRELAVALVESGVFGTAGGEAAMQQVINETILRRGSKGLIDVVRQARMPTTCNLLVVVDQFEELFRLIATRNNQSKEEAAAFVKLLIEATRQDEFPIYVTLTMRSEYLGDCTQFHNLPEAINEGQYLIPRMTRDQKRLAITGPVAVGGATISPRLVQNLLNDIGDNPDQLPIMQHAMMRSWAYWEAEKKLNNPIDLPHYKATGGMKEALSRHADEAFEELADKKSKEITKIIFKRLTGKGAHNRETRFPATLHELSDVCDTDQSTVARIINVFRREGRSFLMPPSAVPLTSDSLIDISHESLIRIWKRLLHWVDEEAQSSRLYRRLSETAALYSKNEAGLWRDPDLQIALEWRKKNQPNEIWAQRYNNGFSEAMSFLDKSRRAARRRKILLLTATVVPPLIVLSLYVYSLNKTVSGLKDSLTGLEDSLTVKESNILDLQSIVSDSKEVMQNLAQKLTLNVTEAERDDDDDEDTKIIMREASGAAVKLQETVEQVEKMEQSVMESELKVAALIDRKEQPLETSIANSEDLAYDRITDINERCQDEKKQYQVSIIPNQLLHLKSCLHQQDLTETDRQVINKKINAIKSTILTSATIASDKDFITCRNVSALTPQGCREQFSAGRVYLFARVLAPRNEVLKLVWSDEGNEIGTRELVVKKSPQYRTFAWKSFHEKGSYRVALFNQNSEKIAERFFSVK